MKQRFILLAGVLLASAWLTQTAAQTINSGIQGVVVAVRATPIPQPAMTGVPVPGATILIYQTFSGIPAGSAVSDQSGQFQVALPPGDYLVVPTSTSVLVRGSSVRATVFPGEYTEVTVGYVVGSPAIR